MPDHLHAALTHRFEQVFQRGVEMRDLHEAEAIADRFRQFLDAPDDPNSTVESEASSSSFLQPGQQRPPTNPRTWSG